MKEIMLLILIGVVLLYIIIISYSSQKTEKSKKITKESEKKKQYVLLEFFQKNIPIKFLAWVVMIWLVIVWFWDLPFNPKTAIKEDIPNRISSMIPITKNTNKFNVAVITFANGENQKQIKYHPGQWTPWIEYPYNAYREYYLSSEALVQFEGEPPFKDAPGKLTKQGERPRKIRFQGISESGYVTLSLTKK